MPRYTPSKRKLTTISRIGDIYKLHRASFPLIHLRVALSWVDVAVVVDFNWFTDCHLEAIFYMNTSRLRLDLRPALTGKTFVWFSGGSTGAGRRGRSPPRRPPAPQKTATPTVFLLRTKRAFFIFVLVKHSRSFNSSSSPHTMPPQLICRCVSSVTLTLLCVLHSTNWLPPVHNYLLIAVTGSHVSLTSFWRFWTNTVNSTCFSQQNVEWTFT